MVALCAAGLVVLPAAANAQTKVVYAGGPGGFASKLQKKYGAGVNNFLINKVTIHAGDTVSWDGKSLAGGFHSIDIPAAGGSDLPLILPTATPVSNALDPGGSPFWFNGLPNLTFNTALFGASGGNVYNGTSRIDSGLPISGPKSFNVKFTKPGVYHYFCDVHYGMEGTVVVLAKSKKIPTAKQDAKTLKTEEKAYVASAKVVDKTKVKGNNVSLGESGPNGLEVFAMFPAKLKVKTGATVTFSMSAKTRETHTATFGDTSAPNGYVFKLAQTGFAGPGISPIAAYPSDVPMPIKLSPASHGGSGFANTGALDRDSSTPLKPSATITFTAPGTYHFICLVHPFMHGVIVVK
jgi:plastocyanin